MPFASGETIYAREARDLRAMAYEDMRAAAAEQEAAYVTIELRHEDLAALVAELGEGARGGRLQAVYDELHAALNPPDEREYDDCPF